VEKRLHRSRTEKMIAGVCGGLAEYFGVDPTIIRVIWVLITLLAGFGVLLYLILWLVMPLDLPELPRR
jgi:phage shock protein C